MTRAAALLVAAVTVVSCGGCGAPPENVDATLDGEACARFARTMTDFGTGTLTTGELRTRLQHVYEIGRLGSPRIVAASRGALAEVTNGTAASAIVAFREMTAACLKTDVNDPRITRQARPSPVAAPPPKPEQPYVRGDANDPPSREEGPIILKPGERCRSRDYGRGSVTVCE
jgi:hypothetical protein